MSTLEKIGGAIDNDPDFFQNNSNRNTLNSDLTYANTELDKKTTSIDFNNNNNNNNLVHMSNNYQSIASNTLVSGNKSDLTYVNTELAKKTT